MKTTKRERFNPHIGAYCAENWWQLGKQIEAAKERPRELDGLCRKILKQLAADGYTPDEINQIMITPQQLAEFYKEVLEILEDKFDKKPVLPRYNRLVGSHPLTYIDAGSFFNLVEDNESFWALEYDSIFDELQKPLKTTRGWLKAVGRCKDPNCNKFFVKSRSNQEHHSEACRVKLANRESYRRSQGQKRSTNGRKHG